MERLNALYASALYELTIERDDINESLEEAVFLKGALKDTDMMRVLKHPQIPRGDKLRLINETFSGKLKDDLFGFLKLALEKNRQGFIVSILEAYIGMIEKHKNIVTAKVITATSLDDNQTAELRNSLSKKLNKVIRLDIDIDPSVVAGPYIYVDGYYLDWTFKTRLRELTVHMKEGV